jgi:heme oxygenase (biliverdin-IX-beta and delta-forming)
MKPIENALTHAAEQGQKPPVVMSLLKTETTPAHKQLERTNCFVRLFDPSYALHEYKQLLCRFYGFFAAVEPLLFDGLTAEQSAVLGHKVKAHLLAMDLSILGMDESEQRNLPRCEELPRLSSFAQKMGVLYVLEGSTLGGRVISKRLKDHFGDTVLDKLNYYSCYGDNIGFEWKSFQIFMGSQFDDKADEIPVVITAANDTFLALHQWLDKE